MIAEIEPEALKARIDAGEAPGLLDVREPAEWEAARLEGATHLPLGQLQARVGELDPQREWVVYCRSGGRSMRAAQFLSGKGFRSVLNLRGGIHAWSDRVDPAMPKP